MVSSGTVIQPLKEQFAPYAATSNVMDVIMRKRERGLPGQVSPAALETISIPKGNASRTLQALNFLGLIDTDGTQTTLFEKLARAGEDDGGFVRSLEGVVREAYEKVFAIVDPVLDSEVAVRDAFRQFEPEAQRDRMVTFFLGMCESAGIVQGKTRERRRETKRNANGLNRRTRSVTTTDSVRETHTPASDTIPRRISDEDSEYRLVFALMQQLPNDRQWNADRRQKWFAAVQASVDLIVTVVEEASGSVDPAQYEPTP